MRFSPLTCAVSLFCLVSGAARAEVTLLATDEQGTAPADSGNASAGIDGPIEDDGPEAERSAGGEWRYTRDLDDEALARAWREDLPSLGSISVGVAAAGRLINGVQMPRGEAWVVVDPRAAYGTDDVISALVEAAGAVRERFVDAPPLRVNHISRADGGYLRPHRSHQNGRDVDLGFYYKSGVDPRHLRGHREDEIDPAANWELLRQLIIRSDVKVILVDRRIQRVLFEHARSIGEDPAWLDSLFRSGHYSIFQHARRHRDHFHIRFYSPRAQELGRRIQPLLAQVPEQNLVVHRVRRGETLSHIARRYGSSVRLIQRRNGMRSSFLRAGRVLTIPLRGPCTRCPLPPPVVVPPRRLPPNEQLLLAAAEVSPSVEGPALASASSGAGEALRMSHGGAAARRRGAAWPVTLSSRTSGCLAP